MALTVLSYNYMSQSNQPPSGNCNQSQSSPQYVSFSFTDANSVDQTTFLESVVVDDQITVNGVTWTVTAIQLKGSNVQFTVDPAVNAPPYGICDFSFSQSGESLTQYIVTDADIGKTIATNGVLFSITFLTPQTGGLHDVFSLIDDSNGEFPLFNIHPAVQFISPGTVFSMGGHHFGNLTVNDVPAGCQFEVVYGPAS
jgi:hypothetical protein